LKESTTKQTLHTYFEKFGALKRVDLIMDNKSPGRNRGFAFVHYQDIQGCEQACQSGQFHKIDENRVEVKRAVLKQPGSEESSPGINPMNYGYGMMGTCIPNYTY